MAYSSRACPCIPGGGGDDLAVGRLEPPAMLLGLTRRTRTQLGRRVLLDPVDERSCSRGCPVPLAGGAMIWPWLHRDRQRARSVAACTVSNDENARRDSLERLAEGLDLARLATPEGPRTGMQTDAPLVPHTRISSMFNATSTLCENRILEIFTPVSPASEIALSRSRVPIGRTRQTSDGTSLSCRTFSKQTLRGFPT